MNERPRFDGAAALSADAVWKRLTAEANRAFKSGDLLRAEDLYDQALQEAQRRFRTDRGATTMDSAPPMLVAACGNAAECHASIGDLKRAALLAFEALDALRAAMVDAAEVPAFRQACFHHLKPALFEYAERAETARVTPATFQQVALRTREAALAFLSENQTRH
jgi:hypothetical protein